jgi:triose/dihydroxyacetone kinase / FAD-AMP lyase (cyclizing)
MGIHNEAGNKRLSPIPRLNHLIDLLLNTILSTDDIDRSFVPFRGGGQDKVVVLVNNLGGLSELELSAVANEVSLQLLNKNVRVERLLSGTFMVF